MLSNVRWFYLKENYMNNISRSDTIGPMTVKVLVSANRMTHNHEITSS